MELYRQQPLGTHFYFYGSALSFPVATHPGASHGQPLYILPVCS